MRVGRTARVWGLSVLLLMTLASTVAMRPADRMQIEPTSQASRAEDDRILAAFRADVLKTISAEAYRRYEAETDPQKRRTVFVMAVRDVQIALTGLPDITKPEGMRAKALEEGRNALVRLLGQFLQSFTGVEIRSLASLARPILGQSRWSVDDLNRAFRAGQAPTQRVIAEFVSPQKAVAFPAAPLHEQADMVLEAAVTILTKRPWPTTFIVASTDVDFVAHNNVVGQLLGKESSEYREWDSLSQRQRGAAVTRAFVTSLDETRLLAQEKMTADEWARRFSTDLDQRSASQEREALMLAGGKPLFETYQKASKEERHRLLALSMAKNAGWMWALQAAL